MGCVMDLDDNYILDDAHEPRRASWPEYLEWSKRGFDETKRVAKTDLDDGVQVSTVFLTIDHNWGSGQPILFESMVFGGDHDQDQWRAGPVFGRHHHRIRCHYNG